MYESKAGEVGELEPETQSVGSETPEANVYGGVQRIRKARPWKRDQQGASFVYGAHTLLPFRLEVGRKEGAGMTVFPAPPRL